MKGKIIIVVLLAIFIFELAKEYIYPSLVDKSPQLIYIPEIKTSDELKKWVDEELEIEPPYNVDFNFHLKAKNASNIKVPMSGWSTSNIPEFGWNVNTWREGERKVENLGSTPMTFSNDYCKIIIKENSEIDTLINSSTSIEIQYFYVYADEFYKGTKAPWKISMPHGGIYKVNNEGAINFISNEKLYLVAYLSVAGNPYYESMTKEQKGELEKLSFDNFIKLHVKKNDGFVVFFQSRNSENFKTKK